MTETVFSLTGKKVWVAGHRGMVGSAVARRLAREDCQILTASRAECDLTRQDQVEAWIAEHRPDAIFLVAARVGGIFANINHPAEFIYENLMLQANVIEAARRFGVGKLLFVSSSCTYPRLSPQPMKEEHLWTGPLEPTNQAYAVAKLAGLQLCQDYRRQYGCDFITALPCNLYGPGDNFDLNAGHVVASLILKFHQAKVENRPDVELWGTGTPRREFLYIDDAAEALVMLMKSYSSDQPINVGAGTDVSIRELAGLVGDAVGYGGAIRLNPDKPDGMPRKLLDVSRLNDLGWRPATPLPEGIRRAYDWWLQKQASAAPA